MPPAPASPASLSDGFGRRISYLRLSVTDRCDMRCRYCMAEAMRFMPREAVLSLEEMAEVADRFIARGVRKIRLTGGEPLVRRGVDQLARMLGRHIGDGLDELTLTTNGNHLARHAPALADAGVRRVNVSLDSLDPDRFRHITRWGELDHVLAGIGAAKAAGLHVKINMVALKGLNEDGIAPMLRWCGEHGHDLTLIETMPLGAVDEDRADRFLPLDGVKARPEEQFTLVPLAARSGGPARYWHVAETGGRLGLITPLTANFCDGCNRVRLSAEGRLHLCLGHDDGVDLRAVLRGGGGADALDAAIDAALAVKPLRHRFDIAPGAAPAVARHMSVTGGMSGLARLALLASPTDAAQAAAGELRRRYEWVRPEEAEIIIALGGDGYLLQTLHMMLERHQTIPVFGMNLGTVGFLMNEWGVDALDDRLKRAKSFRVLPLRMEATTVDGDHFSIPAINEVSLLRETRQTAWIEVALDGRVVVPELVCDGVLAATPAGSTAYNFSAQGPILPLGSALIALTPDQRVPAPALARRDPAGLVRLRFRVLDPVKRPVSAVADQREVRDVATVDVAIDRSWPLTLMFDPEHALDDRIAMEQFAT